MLVNDAEMLLADYTPPQDSRLQRVRERLRAAWFFYPDGMRLGKRRYPAIYLRWGLCIPLCDSLHVVTVTASDPPGAPRA